jgi:hypothetical protein
MDRLAVADGFDVHDYREGLKLLQQDGDTWTLANRAGYGCPACGDAFERVFVAARESVTFGSAPNGPICVARSPGKLLVLTH